MAKTFEQIVAEEEAKFKREGSITNSKGERIISGELNPLEAVAEGGVNPSVALGSPVPLNIGLPGLSETKNRISGRGELIDELAGISNLKIDPLSSRVDSPTLKSIVRGQEIPAEILARGVMSAGTAIKALEGGVAGSLLAGLEGKPENMVDEFIQGVTGQKQTQLGDLVRATEVGGKFNEPIAATAGFLATLGLTNLASGGKIAKGTQAVNQSLKRASVKGARNKALFFRNQSKAFIKGFDDVFSSMRGEYDELYKKIGNKVVGGDDAIAMQDAIVSMPKDIATKLRKIKGVNFIDKHQRVPDFTINNAKIIKDQISRTIPRNVWNGVDDGGTNAELYRQMKDSYFKLNDVIANNAGSLKNDLLKLNARYKALNTFSEQLTPLLKTKTGLVKSLKGIRRNEDAAEQLRRFSNRFFKDGRGVIDRIDKMNNSIAIQQGFKSVVKKFGPAAIAGTAAGLAVGKPISKAISNIGGGSAPSGRGE